MKAVRYDSHGDSGVLVYEEADRPLAGVGQVVVQVAGAGSHLLRISGGGVDLWSCRSSSLCCRAPAAHDPADEEFHREVHAADHR